MCKDIKDKTLAKYFLDNFTKRLNELTPNLYSKKNNFKKTYNPLQQTKDLNKKRNQFGEKE